jgi:hypothetical protein
MRFSMDELLAVLGVAQWPRCNQCKVMRSDRGVIFQRGGMQAVAVEVANRLIEVVYEYALHEVTRERCTPAQAARLLQLIFQRERLCKVAGAGAEPTEEAGRRP